MATMTDGIIVPIQIDGGQLKNDLKTGINDINNFVSEIKKSFDALNKEAVFKMNKQALDKDIKDIQEQLSSIDKNKLRLSAEIETKDIKKQLDFLETQSKRLNEKLKFRLEVQEAKDKSLRTLNKEIKDINNILKEKNKVIIDADPQTFRKTKKEIDDLEEQLKKLEETRDLKVEINKSNFSQIQASLSAMRKMAVGVAAGVGAITAALVGTTKQAMDFETAFAEVRTLINDMPESGISQLKQGLVDLSKQTGILTNESIPAMYQAISASVPADNVVAFLETASKNAIGGVTDLQTSVDGLTTVLNAYAMDTSEVTNVSDLMFETMKRGKTTIGELSRSLFNVVPYASSSGIAFRDISAALATITAQGTPTSVATTQLRQAIVELSDEGAQAGKTFQSLAGKSFKEFIASGKNLQDALQLMEAKAKATNVGVNTLWGSVDAGAAVLSLTGNNTERFTADMEAMANAAGATEEAFKKIDETPAQRLKKIQAQFSAITLEIGNKLLPTAEKLIAIAETNMPKRSKTIQAVGNVIVGLVKNMNILLPIVAGVGTGFLALNVALAITAPASMGVATGIKAIAVSFTLLNASTFGIIAALGLFAGLLVAIKINSKDFVSELDTSKNKAKELQETWQKTSEAAESSARAGRELLQEYKELSEKSEKTREEQERLQEVLKQLQEIYPDLTKKIQEKNGVLDSATLTLDDYISILEKQTLQEIENAIAQERSTRAIIEKEKAALRANLVLYRPDEDDKKQRALERINELNKQITESLARQAEAEDKRDSIERNALRTMRGEKVDSPTVSTSITKTSSTADAGGNEKDPIAELKKRWQASKEFINKAITDEDEKNAKLFEINKKFFGDLESLTKKTYEDLTTAGKNKSATEKKYLQDLVKDNIWAREELEKLNGKMKESGRLEQLKKEYEIEKDIINKTVSDNEDKNKRLKALELKYLQDQLTEKKNQLTKLLSLSEEEKLARAEDIASLYSDIEDLENKIKDFSKMNVKEALASQWQNIVGSFQSVVNSLTSIWSNMWSNQIDIVQDALDEELKIIEDTLDEELDRIEGNLKEQQKMYDAQIKETEKREEERKKIIEDTQKEIDEINEEIGEHTTEEKYKQLEEQREALEEKLQAEQEALEQDELYRQELETQKTLREDEANKLKKQKEDEAQALKEQKEREAAIKTAELKRKQAIMDKATGVFNATVALASGIAQATAAGSAFPPVLIPLYVSLVVAAAAGQIAAIAATPLPEIPQFASGGYVPSGNENYYKGLVGTSGNNTDKTLVWASEGERILNHAETKQWEYYQSRELKSINNNTVNNQNPVINLGGITINAGVGQDAKKLANLSGKAIAKSVVMAITRGYNS